MVKAILSTCALTIHICAFSQFQCGDSLEYAGYVYPTVEIAGSCWFSKNLRTDSCDCDQSKTLQIGSPYFVIPEFPAASGYDDSGILAEAFGLAYNVYSLRSCQVCPTGWTFPSEQDWMNLEGALEVDDKRAFFSESPDKHYFGFYSIAGIRGGIWLGVGNKTVYWTSDIHRVWKSKFALVSSDKFKIRTRALQHTQPDLSIFGGETFTAAYVRCIQNKRLQ